MKGKNKKILLFIIYLLLVLFINSFIKNILSGYNMIIFLLITLVVFNLLFVFEKARYRYLKDIIFEITICLLIFFLLFYLFGIVIGFYKVDNYYNLNGIFKFILPITLNVILKEFFRYQLLNKLENKKILILSVILFIFIDVSNYISFINPSVESIFVLFALNILPSISSNIFLSYLSLNTSYIPCIYYSLTLNLYQYLLPIIPNPSKYLISLINLLLPIILLLHFRRIIIKEKDLDALSRNNNKYNYLGFSITALFVFVLVYFNSGYFKHMSIAVASDSMYPFIKKGDVVIVQKGSKDLDVGSVIAYKYSGVIIVHRIERREVIDDKYYYYTKGDANQEVDDWLIEDEMIIGNVILKVPYFGIPTIWLRDIWLGG